MIGSLSRRYARALIELARETEALDAFGVQLENLKDALHKSSGSLDLLSDSLFPLSQRVAAINEIADQSELKPLLKNFLLILVQKERMDLFPEIVREFGRLRDEILGIVRVAVFTPGETEVLLLSQIEKILANRLKKKVIARGGVRPNMIGGLILEVDHTIYDGSIRRDLERVREKLLKEPIM